MEPLPPPPKPPPVLCPVEGNARLQNEALPPEGFTEEAFVDALVAAFGPDLAIKIHAWLMSDWKPWAREGWTRVGVMKKFCDDLAAKAQAAANAP